MTAPNCDPSRVHAIHAQGRELTRLMFDPVQMAAEVAAFSTLREAADAPAVDIAFDWEELLSEGTFDPPLVNLLPGLKEIPDWAFEYIVDHFLAQLDMTLESSPELSDEEWEDLHEFIRAPSVERASRHPLLRQIPDAVDRMHAIESARQREWARRSCSEGGEPVVLTARLHVLPTEPAFEIGPLEAWVRVTPDCNNIDHENPDIFVVTAVLVKRTGEDSGDIVASLAGELIPLLRDGGFVHPNDVFEIMDAHTQMLNDIWKDLHGVFLPKHRLKRLDQIAEPGEGAAVCCPWIEVAEPYRGKGLSSLLLQAVAELAVNATETGFAAPSDGTADRCEDDDEEAEDDPWADETPSSLARLLEDNPIRLYVLQVEGTRPPSPAMRHVLARGDLRKEAKPKVTDSVVERRRRALEAYFQKVDKNNPEFYVHTYNPWDYPFT